MFVASIGLQFIYYFNYSSLCTKFRANLICVVLHVLYFELSGSISFDELFIYSTYRLSFICA